MVASCAFGGGCGKTENLVRREHVPTGQVHHYCADHAPEPDGDTWRVP